MNQNPPPSNQSAAMGGDSMGFEPFNSLEMKGGIASDNYSMFSANDNTMFLHSYEMIGGGGKGPNQPPPPPSGQYHPPQGTLGGGNGNGQSDSRSSQKQDKFEQELALKRALRDQDISAPQSKKMDGVPQNFNQMWEQQQGRH